MSYKLAYDLAVRRAVDPIALSPGTSTAVVLDGLASGATEMDDGVCVIQAGIATGSPAPTSWTLNAKLQDSADNSTFADAKDESGNTYQITALTAAGVARIDFNRLRLRRYVQVVLTFAQSGGTSTALPVSAAFAMGGGKHKPINP